jgi:hypothetical protein
MARKKPEGIEILTATAPEPVSIQEITMLDWYAAFALMGIGSEASNTTAVSMAFDRAELMMAEREKRGA